MPGPRPLASRVGIDDQHLGAGSSQPQSLRRNTPPREGMLVIL